MANTPTTPASLASRLTDEEIERLANDCNERAYDFGFDTLAHNDEKRKAAVLRDYVRMRKDYMQAIEIARHNYKELKRFLAEAEKGEEK